MVGMTIREVSPHCHIPLQLPLTYVNQPEVLSLAKVIISNIHVNRLTRQLKGNIDKYTGDVEGVYPWCPFHGLNRVEI
jgi:hypothetical protein